MAVICIVWVEAVLIGNMVLASHIKEIDFIQPEEDQKRGKRVGENLEWDPSPMQSPMQGLTS